MIYSRNLTFSITRERHQTRKLSTIGVLSFFKKPKKIRINGKHIMLILDGYSGHIQYKFLNMMKENRVILIALPSHTYHFLHPLDLSVFSPYKHYLQSNLHIFSRLESKLNSFTVAFCFFNAYSSFFVSPNICSGFVKHVVWCEVTINTNVEFLIIFLWILQPKHYHWHWLYIISRTRNNHYYAT